MTQKYLNAVCKPKSLVFMFLSKKCQISEFTAGGDRSLQFEGIFNALIIDLTSEFFLTMDCTIFVMFNVFICFLTKLFIFHSKNHQFHRHFLTPVIHYQKKYGETQFHLRCIGHFDHLYLSLTCFGH